MAAFERGLKVAGAPEGRAGVLSTIFSTRGLTGELAPASQADYLSGLLIGHEIAALAALLRAQGQAPRIVLCGEPALCERYAGHDPLRPGRARAGAERHRARPVAPGAGRRAGPLILDFRLGAHP